MDLYIPWPRKTINTKCAFVRYKGEKELIRAIQIGHGRRIYKRQIRVAVAMKPKIRIESRVTEEGKSRNEGGLRGNITRNYKEALNSSFIN